MIIWAMLFLKKELSMDPSKIQAILQWRRKLNSFVVLGVLQGIITDLSINMLQ